MIVPILRHAKYFVEMLIRDDAKRIQYFVLDRLNDSLNVGLQVR